MIVVFIFLAYFPFTKLVHVFSYPFAYITRPYIPEAAVRRAGSPGPFSKGSGGGRVYRVFAAPHLRRVRLVK